MIENQQFIGSYYPDPPRPEPDPDEAYDRKKQYEMEERDAKKEKSNG